MRSFGTLHVGVGLLATVIAGVLLSALVQGQNGYAIGLTQLMQAPNAKHWLGTDELGRDMLARTAQGIGLSLTVALSVGLLTAIIGIPLGLLAGWLAARPGWRVLDEGLVKLADIVLSFPGLLLALALTALLGPSLVNVIMALGLLGWVGFFRLTRVQVLSLRGRPFVQAAQVVGLPTLRILFRHILPNALGPLVVEMVVVVAGSLVAEAGLSFLGLGVPPPVASLGGMIKEGSRYVLLAPHMVTVPAVVLFCLVAGVNLVAEGLRRRWLGGR